MSAAFPPKEAAMSSAVRVEGGMRGGGFRSDPVSVIRPMALIMMSKCS